MANALILSTAPPLLVALVGYLLVMIAPAFFCALLEPHSDSRDGIRELLGTGQKNWSSAVTGDIDLLEAHDRDLAVTILDMDKYDQKLSPNLSNDAAAAGGSLRA